jgi:hypothetical protein
MNIKEDAEIKARSARHELIDFLEDYPLNHKIWKLLANALVGEKIVGYLDGLDTITDTIELEAYARGYKDGLADS